eukprot:SAG31_NODE_33363_length_344_cov_1.273469_1_plen_48_part_01
MLSSLGVAIGATTMDAHTVAESLSAEATRAATLEALEALETIPSGVAL